MTRGCHTQIQTFCATARHRYSTLLALVLLLALAGCAVPQSHRGTQDPLVYDAAALASAERIAIFIPGVLTSINIFEETKLFEEAGFARVFFRYPGLDGLPLDHRLSPQAAAARIVAFANAHPDKDVALVGYSTGGPIALLAAAEIHGPDRVQVAAISTGVDYGGGFPTALRGVRDIAAAALAAGSAAPSDIWKRYWAGLLYGTDALDDPAFADRLARDIAAGAKIKVDVDPVLALSHTLALPQWELPPDLDLGNIPVAFFAGLNDPVFSTAQTLDFARKVGDVPVYGYHDQGHLLFFTQPQVFADVLRFVQGRPVVVHAE